MRLILKCFAVFTIAWHLQVCYTKRSTFPELDQSLTPFAVKEYIEEYFIKNTIKFEVIYNSKAQESLDETLKLISDIKSYRVTQVDSRIRANGKNYFQIAFSAILFFDSFKNYLQFEDRINIEPKGAQDRNLLIVCANLTTKEIERNIPDDEYQIRQYLIEEKGTISLKATTLFTPRACHKQQLIEINQFSKKKLKWMTTKFSMSKIDNFYGCTLKICHSDTRPLSSQVKYSCEVNGKCTWSFNGYLFLLTNELSRDLNFKVDPYLKNSQTPYYVHWNGKAKEFQKVSKPVRFDWESTIFPIGHVSFYYFFLSSPITSDSQVILVPPGANYTSEEKFLLPFDTTTWILFGIVFAVAFAVLGLLRIFKSPSSISFVLGENVSEPGLNIIGVFMGIGQLTLPKRSIARVFLMIFILFCLIMRTAYQGVFYELLTTDPQKKPIRSMEELVVSKLPIYRMIDSQSKIEDEFLHKYQTITVSKNEMEAQMDQLRERKSSYEGTILYPKEVVTYDSKQVPEKDRQTFYMIEDVYIMSYNMAINFKIDSFLFPSFDKLITAYLENGLFEKWINVWTKRVRNLAKEDKEGAKVLTLDQLSAGFKFWLFSLLLPIIAFLGELCWFWFPRVWRRLMLIMTLHENRNFIN